MRKQISLAISIGDERDVVYQAMAARSNVVHLVERPIDADALISNDLDAVSDAIGSGKRGLLVDPFATANSDCDRLAATGSVAPALTSRFLPSIQQIIQALDAGKLGEPGLLRIHLWHHEASANSYFLEQQLDLAVWLFGKLPTVVYGSQRPGYTQVHLGFGEGMALVDIDTTGVCDNSYYSLSLIGSSGAAYADDHHNANLIFARDGARAIQFEQEQVAIAVMIDRFATSMASGETFSASFDQIKAVKTIAQQIVQSASRGLVLSGDSHG